MSHDWREDEPIGEYVDKDGKDIEIDDLEDDKPKINPDDIPF